MTEQLNKQLNKQQKKQQSETLPDMEKTSVKEQSLDEQSLRELSRNLYALGQAIKANENEETTSALLSTFQQSLDGFIQLTRIQKLKHWFRLNDLELKLIAIAFVNVLEPETVAPFLGLSWFDHGATLTLERVLLLCQKNPQSKVTNLNMLLSNLKVFHWKIIFISEHSQPLIQSLNLAPDIFSYLLGNTKSLDNTPVVIRCQFTQDDIVISECFDQLLKQPLAQVNTLSGLNSDERTALVAQFASNSALPLHHVVQDVINNFSTNDVLGAFRQVILFANGNDSYVYWADLLSYIQLRSESDWLLPLLLSNTKLILFFDQPKSFFSVKHHVQINQAGAGSLNSDSNSESINWLNKKRVEQCLPPNTQQLSLVLSSPEPETVAKAWLALSAHLLQKQVLKQKVQQQNSQFIQPLSTENADYLANLYPLYPSVMSQVAAHVNELLEENNDSESLFHLLQQACLQANSEITGQLASLSQPRYQLHDMILADNTREQIQELIDRLRYKSQLSQAISDFMPGIQALFWGKPGTGKSMAAEAIAGQLKLPLYKVNLANVASKWIGESEKHLAKLFDDAQKQNAVLMFDEADAIFAKRSEVESSQDKNANMGVSYLLQRMETYTGLLLLSTNFKSNLDEAFLRRFHGVVEFPLPNEKLRFQLWQQVWGNRLLIASGINLKTLAQHFEFSPSQIKNIAERSVLFALKAQQKNVSKHLLGKAIMRELEKQNASFLAEQQLNNWLALT